MKAKTKTNYAKRLPANAPRKTGSQASKFPPASVGPVIRLKRILVTTDFSIESKKALPYAAAFAERLGGEVALLHVVEPPPRFAGLESIALLQSGDAAMGRVFGALDALAGQTFGTKTRVTTHARTGKPFHVITNTAQELPADLIIMATHGYSGLKHTFLGSTTERVVRHAPCPVLAVRGAENKPAGRTRKPVAIQRIVLATDFSEHSMKAFPLAQSLAVGFGARLTLMHVVEKFPIDAMLGQELARDTSERLTGQARAQLMELAAALRRRDGLQADVAVRFGKPFDEITRGAKELDASLIVLSTHGYTGLKHAYLGSVAERVVRHAHCPVLVVRPNEK